MHSRRPRLDFTRELTSLPRLGMPLEETWNLLKKLVLGETSFESSTKEINKAHVSNHIFQYQTYTTKDNVRMRHKTVDRLRGLLICQPRREVRMLQRIV